ncbi:MAG: DUF4832 domain-containing protein [Bacteroidales bacterium]|nr:DUF4832 domain-containing protein [Bacteroidales bacterium]
MKRHCLLFGFVFILLCACTENDDSYPGLQKVTYTSTDENFPNPERGLYSGTSFESEDGAAVSSSVLKSNRKMGRSLYMLECWLKPFFESDISEAYLALIRKSLQAYRGTGAKCILRFGYSNDIKDLKHPENDAPFDTNEEQVLRHIAQLKPILQEYADVIYVMQAGFIGCWGEWHYTTAFPASPTTYEEYLPRKRVTDALLDALPATRQLELRTPAAKMTMYGYSIADTITRAEAHTPTTKARLAGHDDCFLADATDQGTLRSKTDREYWSAESKYVIIGGETCAMSTYCKCDNAIKTMEDQHYSYLNSSFDPNVLNYWSKNSCLNEIRLRLGYRFVLTKGYFTQNPSAGDSMRAVLYINNAGFASVMNPRDAELVLTDDQGEVLSSWPLESDPRYWMGGNTTVIDQSIELPSGISGSCTLWLNLPDPDYRTNPLYSIRLANEEVWDEETGFNKLHTFEL